MVLRTVYVLFVFWPTLSRTVSSLGRVYPAPSRTYLARRHYRVPTPCFLTKLGFRHAGFRPAIRPPCRYFYCSSSGATNKWPLVVFSCCQCRSSMPSVSSGAVNSSVWWRCKYVTNKNHAYTVRVRWQESLTSNEVQTLIPCGENILSTSFLNYYDKAMWCSTNWALSESILFNQLTRLDCFATSKHMSHQWARTAYMSQGTRNRTTNKQKARNWFRACQGCNNWIDQIQVQGWVFNNTVVQHS